MFSRTKLYNNPQFCIKSIYFLCFFKNKESHTTHNNRLYGIINNISINYLYQSLSFLPLLSTHDLYFGYTSSSSIALV